MSFRVGKNEYSLYVMLLAVVDWVSTVMLFLDQVKLGVGNPPNDVQFIIMRTFSMPVFTNTGIKGSLGITEKENINNNEKDEKENEKRKKKKKMNIITHIGLLKISKLFFRNNGFIGTFHCCSHDMEDWVMLVIHLGFSIINELYLTEMAIRCIYIMRINFGL